MHVDTGVTPTNVIGCGATAQGVLGGVTECKEVYWSVECLDVRKKGQIICRTAPRICVLSCFVAAHDPNRFLIRT